MEALKALVGFKELKSFYREDTYGRQWLPWILLPFCINLLAPFHGSPHPMRYEQASGTRNPAPGFLVADKGDVCC